MSSASDSPAIKFLSVSANSSNSFDPLPVALFIGSSGDVEVTDVANNTVIFKNVANGTMLHIRPLSLDANTTANNILALF